MLADNIIAGVCIILTTVLLNFYTHERRIQEIGACMASVEHEPITGVWGLCPQRGTGAVLLVRGQSPPEAEHFFVFHMPEMAHRCYVYELFYGH